MQSLMPVSMIVKTSLSDSLIHISAYDGTNHTYFEAINYSSQIKEMLILAGQGLASNNPLLIEYETLNGVNLFMGVIVTLA